MNSRCAGQSPIELIVSERSVLIDPNMLSRELPIDTQATTLAIDTNPAMNPYSMAVAPVSLAQKIWSKLRISNSGNMTGEANVPRTGSGRAGVTL